MVFPYNTRIHHRSGERFQVVYHLAVPADQVERAARDICLEQTVELPADLVPSGDVQAHIVGQIEAVALLDDSRHAVTISYAMESAGTGMTQFLNVVFGNTSMQPNIEVDRVTLPPSMIEQFRGPRFGREGLRRVLNVPAGPILCTALKPMGLTPEQLAHLAYQLALGGIDLIKDDHGLANQPFCPFEARVEQCAAAVARANRETGFNCLYLPNVTAPHDELLLRARLAKDAGAGGFLISYGLTGFDGMRLLAEDDTLALPVLAHPALSGSFVTNAGSGLSHYFLYGQLARLCGADASIFVSFGGRFPYTRQQCRAAADGCSDPLGTLSPIFPVPSGGMTIERLPELLEFYGQDTILLIAGGLYRYGDDLVENARAFNRAARSA